MMDQAGQANLGFSQGLSLLLWVCCGVRLTWVCGPKGSPLDLCYGMAFVGAASTCIGDVHPRIMCCAKPRSSCSTAELIMRGTAQHARGSCRVNRHKQARPGLNAKSRHLREGWCHAE